jgi:hypothetical protein
MAKASVMAHQLNVYSPLKHGRTMRFQWGHVLQEHRLVLDLLDRIKVNSLALLLLPRLLPPASLHNKRLCPQ